MTDLYDPHNLAQIRSLFTATCTKRFSCPSIIGTQRGEEPPTTLQHPEAFDVDLEAIDVP